MDAFSEILSGVKLHGAVYFSAEFSAPWGFSAPASQAMAVKLGTGAEHLIVYHLLVGGRAVVRLGAGTEVALEPGDVVVFPHGDAHEIASGPEAKAPFPSYGISAKIAARDLSTLRGGGGAGPGGGEEPGPAARACGAGVDDRGPGGRGGHFALGAGGAICAVSG